MEHFSQHISEVVGTTRAFLDEGYFHVAQFVPGAESVDVHGHAYNSIRDTLLALVLMGAVDLAGVRLSGTLPFATARVCSSKEEPGHLTRVALDRNF